MVPSYRCYLALLFTFLFTLAMAVSKTQANKSVSTVGELVESGRWFSWATGTDLGLAVLAATLIVAIGNRGRPLPRILENVLIVVVVAQLVLAMTAQ